MGRKNTMTGFLEDIVNDTKTFVDDLMDRAKDVERHASDAVQDAADDGGGADGDPEMVKLRRSLDDLRKKVDGLSASGPQS